MSDSEISYQHVIAEFFKQLREYGFTSTGEPGSAFLAGLSNWKEEQEPSRLAELWEIDAKASGYSPRAFYAACQAWRRAASSRLWPLPGEVLAFYRTQVLLRLPTSGEALTIATKSIQGSRKPPGVWHEDPWVDAAMRDAVESCGGWVEFRSRSRADLREDWDAGYRAGLARNEHQFIGGYA